MDAHTLNAWTRFALQKGGIGSCTALIDNPATEPEDLMFMAGEKIIVLRRLDDEALDGVPRPTSSTSASLNKRKSDLLPDSDAWFLGYCEGVVGRFKGAHVQFHARLKKPVLMRRSGAGGIRDSSMRPMSKSEAAKMHLSQVPAGIPFTSVDSDGEEDSVILSPVDRRPQAMPLPTMPSNKPSASSSSIAAASSSSSAAAPAIKQGRFGLTTPPLSDEGHLRKQSNPRRLAPENDEDSDDSTSLLPWARHSRESSLASSSSPRKPTAPPTRNDSLARPAAPVRTSSAFSQDYAAHAQAPHTLPTIHHLPPSPISSSESPVHAESKAALPSFTTTSSSRSNSRSGNTSADTTVTANSTVADLASRTSCTSSNSTTSTNDDSDDENGAGGRRRDYTFSIYDVYGRDSVAFPNFDFRQYGSKSSLAKLAASRSSESLNVPGQRSSSATDERLQLPPSPQQRGQHLRTQQPLSGDDASRTSQQQAQSSQQSAAGMTANGYPRRPGQLNVPAANDASIPLALRSPSGRRPSAAPDPRYAGPAGVRGPVNVASSLRRQVETPPVATAAAVVSPLDAAGAALAPNAAHRGPGAFDPLRRPSQTTAVPTRMQPNTLPRIHTGSTPTSTASGSGSSPPVSAGANNSQDSGAMHRPGFAEARQRRRSLSVGMQNKVENLALHEDAHAKTAAPLPSPGQPNGPGSAGTARPNFRTSAGSSRSRTGPSTSPGLGPVRASSDRLSERERVHSGQGSGLLRKNPSNPTPGLHGGSGLHALAPMAAPRSASPMSQLSAPSPVMDGPRRGSAASAGAYSTGPRSPQARSPLGMPMGALPSSAPTTPGSGGSHPNGMFGFPASPGSVTSPGGMGQRFDAMGFVVAPGVVPSMPPSDDPELREKWLAVLAENDVSAALKSRKVKKLVRTGVPASVRREVWLFLANASVRRRPGLFEQLCKTSNGPKGKRGKEEAYDTIEKDLHRTLPDHRLFMGENATGRADLEGILKSYVHFNPMLGYTQGMGLLAAFSLIQMPAEDAFWLLCAVLRNPQMEEYYSAGMKQLHVDSVVFDNLLKTMDPELHARFDQAGLQSIMFTPNWFLPLFTRVLPWTTLLRVWDVFFYEGPTWMLRVALAIVRILREQLMDQQACPTAGEMLQLLLHPPAHNLTVENVLNCAFSVKLKDGEMRKLSRTASKLVREKQFLSQPADARGRASVPTLHRPPTSAVRSAKVCLRNVRELTIDAATSRAVPLLFPQIQQNVDAWKAKGGISYHDLDEATRTSAGNWGMARVVIRDGQLFLRQVREGGESRISALLHLLHTAITTDPSSTFSQNDPYNTGVELVLSEADKDASSTSSAIWVLSKRVSEPASTGTWLLPDFGFVGWPEAGIASFSEFTHLASLQDTLVPWSVKSDRILWRGLANGYAPRVDLLSRTDPSRVSGADTWADVQQTSFHDVGEQFHPIIPMHEHCRYKYLVQTEGNSYSGRGKFLWSCRSVTVAHPMEWTQHFHPALNSDPKSRQQNMVELKGPLFAGLEETTKQLQASAHISSDKDLPRNYTTADGVLELNPPQRIAENAVESLRHRYLTEAATNCYLRAALRGYAGVLKKDTWPREENAGAWDESGAGIVPKGGPGGGVAPGSGKGKDLVKVGVKGDIEYGIWRLSGSPDWPPVAPKPQ